MSTKKKTALITGIYGQDGYYLSRFLLRKKYNVLGCERRISQEREKINKKIKVFQVDITNKETITNLIKETKPDELYNLASQSHVGYSFKEPIITAEATGLSVLYILEAIKNYSKKTRLYQASTSEMFGDRKNKNKMNEKTPLSPNSPYAVAKLFGHEMVKTYRMSYNLFCCSGILFNHESPKRGADFVTQKIIKGLINYQKTGEFFYLGNVNSKRDWGHAKDYVRAMWLMLQQKKPRDYVIASGKARTVRDFVNEACQQLGIKAKWVGRGVKEKLLNENNKKPIIKISKEFYRPADVNFLEGDTEKALIGLLWMPEISFKELIKDMIKGAKK